MVLPDSQEIAAAETVPSEALRALVDAVLTADFGSSRDALEAFAAVTVEICGADAAVVRLVEPEDAGLTAHAVHATSPALAAELAGSRAAVGDETRSSRMEFAFSTPIELDGEPVGSLDILRDASPFSEGERLLAQLAAGELALVLRVLRPRPADTDSAAERALVLAGEALAAGTDNDRIAEHVARLAADAAGARGGRPVAVTRRRAPACGVLRRIPGGGVGGALRSSHRPRLPHLPHPGPDRGCARRERAPGRAGRGRASARVRAGSRRQASSPA